MATADHVESLIKAYIAHDDVRFKTVVLQIAAYEAKLGHENIARKLKTYADNIGKSNKIINLNQQHSMLLTTFPDYRLADLIVSDEVKERIKRILNEFRNRNKLRQYGLNNRRKILIEGNPGTGKTFTASIIASELKLPLYTVQMDKLVTKFMGETSVKLRQIFDQIENSTGVYFFDEFDAIGADRGLDNEVGEMRRILNSFLQFIEQDSSASIIIAATNNQKMLDNALFRRFDDILHYPLPSSEEIQCLFEYKLLVVDSNFVVSDRLINQAKGLSHAEIIRVCDDAIKNTILNDEKIDESSIIKLINERVDAYSKREA